MTWEEFVSKSVCLMNSEQTEMFEQYIMNTVMIKDYICNSGFLTAPASTHYHGSYEGGLAEHSINVMMNLVSLTENNGLKWILPRSPYIIGLFHDLCKVDQYKQEIVKLSYYADGKELEAERHHAPGKYEYNNETLFKGHGMKSAVIASTLMTLTEEEVACIVYHMGAFCDKEEWNDYTRAIHKYPNVLWTHHADMLASHVHEVNKENNNDRN